MATECMKRHLTSSATSMTVAKLTSTKNLDDSDAVDGDLFYFIPLRSLSLGVLRALRSPSYSH